MTATNECTRCGHMWQDRCEPKVLDRSDMYGNRWKLSAYVWSEDHPCPRCGSQHWKRTIREG